MFGVDGLPGIPDKPIPGPNQVLANEMGIVMGLSHHEPMDRTKPEWDRVKTGPWDWTNKEVLIKASLLQAVDFVKLTVALDVWRRKGKGTGSNVYHGHARRW